MANTRQFIDALAYEIVDMVIEDAERCEEFDMLRDDYTADVVGELVEKVNEVLKKKLSV